MTKLEFTFCVGYDGNRALVDYELLNTHKNNRVKDLLSAGLYKCALSLAIFNNNSGDIEQVLKNYNEKSSSKYLNREEAERVFGVFLPQNIEKIKTVYI